MIQTVAQTPAVRELGAWAVGISLALIDLRLSEGESSRRRDRGRCLAASRFVALAFAGAIDGGLSRHLGCPQLGFISASLGSSAAHPGGPHTAFRQSQAIPILSWAECSAAEPALPLNELGCC